MQYRVSIAIAGGMVCLLLLAATTFGQARGRRMPNRARVEASRGINPDPSALRVARLHYSGGGDWYWGNSALPNFLKYLRDNTAFPIDTLEHEVTIMDADLYRYPFLFATGHGVIDFSTEEKERLRQYLAAGGFLFVNDSYGMDQSFRKEMAELFPEREVVEIPFDHPLYHCFHDFPNGPPKIHEHDENPARGYAIILNGRVVLYFLVESDIGDGWEDAQVHNDPPEKREEAFRMGVNIVTYALLY
ncbi:MAG: DUF4159 domain-containing protein [candidate division Zixibacteria bacterium]|nr:DUF4159 domain-containing protein [candidate division Zixibacteria bacterium]MDH3936130.1 DUF4159 domain-containing protein [candidate division Zixibacteria bacterium]MDH4033279.1 DUF4159 domain-containing protein [candidate division Zixibacteria bacterium]